jgi:tripeptide aminopeptidase
MQSERLLNTFLDLVQIDNPSGQETAVVDYIRAALALPGLRMEQDEAFNLVVYVPGTGEPMLFNAHTDSVNPCEGVRPVVTDGIIRSSGDTVLGADDLAGVAAIVEAVRSLRESGEPHCAAELLFTSQEEVGLKGASAFDYSRLRAREGFTFDMTGEPGGICLGAPSQASLSAVVLGRAAHAGLAPEEGINAIRVASEAIVRMPLGRIDAETTANIGIIRGGEATNIVTPRVELRGEARSHNPDMLHMQVAAMEKALHEAADLYQAQVEVTLTYPYHAYRLQEDEPVVTCARNTLQQMGIEPYTFISGGGSDVNVFLQHGLRVANLSLGYRDIHTVNEQIAVADLEFVARLVMRLLQAQAAL